MSQQPVTPSDLPHHLLTGAQQRVARLVAEGLSYRSIATQLGIAPSTVRVHVNAVARSLLSMTGVPAKNRVQMWAGSEDGRTYLAKPHVKRRAEPTESSHAA